MLGGVAGALYGGSAGRIGGVVIGLRGLTEVAFRDPFGVVAAEGGALWHVD